MGCENVFEQCFTARAGWIAHVALLVDSTLLDFCDSVNRYFDDLCCYLSLS